MPIGEPGWPELAACTASMHSVRIVLMATFSMAALSLVTVRPVFMDHLLQRARSLRLDPLLSLELAAGLLADEVIAYYEFRSRGFLAPSELRIFAHFRMRQLCW